MFSVFESFFRVFSELLSSARGKAAVFKVILTAVESSLFKRSKVVWLWEITRWSSSSSDLAVLTSASIEAARGFELCSSMMAPNSAVDKGSCSRTSCAMRDTVREWSAANNS